MTRFFVFAASLALAIALPSQTVFAHASKEATQPSDGSVLAETPPTIGMTFDEPMRITLIVLTDQDGTEHALERSDDMQLVTDFAARPTTLSPGRYTVDWRGLAEDGHPMQGSFAFEIAE